MVTGRAYAWRRQVLTLHKDSWDSPEDNYSLSDAAREGVALLLKQEMKWRATAVSLCRNGGRQHAGFPFPPGPTRDMLGTANMARRAAETEGTQEEVTLYCPSQRLAPHQRLQTHLYQLLPGEPSGQLQCVGTHC